MSGSGVILYHQHQLIMILRSILLSTSAFCALGMTAALPQTGSGETGGYTLVWQDLFDDDELNLLRWNIEVNGSGGGNNELQYYTDRPENVSVGDDGKGNHCLILTARREEYKNKHFTSGRVNTKNFVAFTHGKVEASIRLPKTANGLWPAFWMMGNDYDAVGWPKCGETDILEMGHQNGISSGMQDRFFNGAAHWGPQWPQASHAQDCTKSYSLQDDEYHLFTLIWDDDTMAMYVDLDKQPKQIPYFKLNIPKDDPSNEWSAGNYFHKNNFILFNLAIGGNFPGIWDATGITALNDRNEQHQSMYVNFVKVYQKNNPTDDFYSVVAGDSESSDNSAVTEISEDESGPTINVDCCKAESEGSELTVYDACGNIVGCGENCVFIGCLPIGMYIIRAKGPQGLSSLKIIK